MCALFAAHPMCALQAVVVDAEGALQQSRQHLAVMGMGMTTGGCIQKSDVHTLSVFTGMSEEVTLSASPLSFAQNKSASRMPWASVEAGDCFGSGGMY